MGIQVHSHFAIQQDQLNNPVTEKPLTTDDSVPNSTPTPESTSTPTELHSSEEPHHPIRPDTSSDTQAIRRPEVTNIKRQDWIQIFDDKEDRMIACKYDDLQQMEMAKGFLGLHFSRGVVELATKEPQAMVTRLINRNIAVLRSSPEIQRVAIQGFLSSSE